MTSINITLEPVINLDLSSITLVMFSKVQKSDKNADG